MSKNVFAANLSFLELARRSALSGDSEISSMRSKLNDIYKRCHLSVAVSFPTIFDAYCDLHERGAVANRDVAKFLKAAIDFIGLECQQRIETEKDFLKNIKQEVESWSRDYEFGLSNCIAARLFLEDSLGKGNELKQELIFKAYHLENRDYTLQELGKFFAFKSNLSWSAGPLEPKGLTLGFMMTESEKRDLDQIITLLERIDSVKLPTKDAFLADYRIERNLATAKNSYGDKKVTALKNAFSLGHVESALPIAKRYFERGRYVEAVEWLVCSLKVEQCEAEAAYLIAAILEKYDKDRAEPFYKLSAETGWAKACFKLAQSLINRGSNKEGFRWYVKAANNKDPEALYRVGNFYFYGLANIEKDVRHAFELYCEAANRGVRAAAYCVGRMYLHGIGVKQSNALAEKYFRQAAGHPGADCALAMMYLNAPGQESWVRQKLLSAGLKGNAQALNQLGKLLRTKLFVACSESNYLLINAALMGCYNAINNLFLLWHEGTFVSYIPFDVEANLKVAMEKGDADSMVSYAQFCLKPGARLAYFTQAAKKNSLEAIYQLGEMYACGDGVQQSDEKAAILFSGAAKRGHATATYRLAQCYERGAGVTQSRAIAQQLYAKAGQMGNWDAKFASWGMTLEDCGQELYQALENAERRINLMLEKDK